MATKTEEKIVDSIEISEEELKEQEGKFFVKDGQVFIKETDDENKTEEKKGSEEFSADGYNKDGYDKYGYNEDGFDIDGYDDDGKDKDGSEKEELTEDDLKGTIYEGKTVNEIALMHKKALETTTHTPAPTVIDEGKVVKDAAYYETELDKIEDKLDGMNKFDDGFDDLRKQQRQLNRRYIAASQREIIETNVNAEKNVEFIGKKRQEYSDLEIEITPTEFDDVTSYAEKYMERGKLTDRSFTKGLIDKFGSEKVIKFFTINAEKETRRKIKEAGTKVEKKISTKVSKAGGGVKLRNISSMNARELDLYLEPLSPAELSELYEKQTRR